MKIISAIDYGYRTVLRVCLNPDQPNWVHVVGEHMRDREGVPMYNDSGGPVLLTSDKVSVGETGENCHNCRQNWEIVEVIFEGADLYGEDMDGGPVRLSDDDLAVMAFTRVSSYGPPRVLGGILGQSD